MVLLQSNWDLSDILREVWHKVSGLCMSLKKIGLMARWEFAESNSLAGGVHSVVLGFHLLVYRIDSGDSIVPTRSPDFPTATGRASLQRVFGGRSQRHV